MMTPLIDATVNETVW